MNADTAAEAGSSWLVTHPLPALGLAIAVAVAVALGLWTFIHAGATSDARIRRRRNTWAIVLGMQAVLVAIIAWNVGQEGALSRLDQRLASQLAAHAPDTALWALSRLTRLGDRDWLLVVGGGVMLVLLIRRRWTEAVEWIVATAGSGLLTTALKALFARVRPEHVHGFEVAHGWSFPSGHASGAMAVYGMLCFIAMRHAPARWRPLLLAGAVALVLGVGMSRVVLQVHFLSDVLAGFATASLWLAACVAISAAWRRRALTRAEAAEARGRDRG